MNLSTHKAYNTKIKAVLFDMDGVLYDSMPTHAKAWVQTTDAMGISATPEDFYLLEGANARYTVNFLFNRAFGRSATEQEIDDAYNIKARNFNAFPRPNIMKGAKEVVELVRSHGLTPVIVTGTSQMSLIENVTARFDNAFDPSKIVSGMDVINGKPHPDPYLLGLKKGGINAEEAIVIENAPLGVKAAKAAGIFTIGVNTGPLSNNILSDAGADVVFKSMDEVCCNLQKILSTLI